MYNSCTFNTVKYNSLCVREAVIPPKEVSGTANIRVHKRRLFRREFFPIEGIKLFYCKQLINLIGTVLSHKIYEIEIKGQKLFKVEAYNELYGTLQFFVQFNTSLTGSKIFKEISYVGIEGKGLMPTKQIQLIKGKKLIPSLHSQLIKGSVKIPYMSNKLIRGKKDISDILKALEIMGMDE